MFGKIIRLVVSLLLIVVVASCGKPDETHEVDRLSYSFRNAKPELRQYVEGIVKEAEQLEYQNALNKLALMSATRKLTAQQKNAVDLLVKRLRYDMEEEIFSAQRKKE